MAPESAGAPPAYEPRARRMRTFHDAVPGFLPGSDTPRAYLERCLAVIEAREGALRAFAHLDAEGARRAADAAGARYAAGRPLGPVDGLPLGIKDLYDTADMPTTYGSALFAGHRPIRDAAVVYQLRRGGAVLVGKTETVAFGGGDPAPTRNPFDPARTPGGSSAGSAAAVGAAMLPAAIGTHARGSTIRPASYCGTYALKPTYGAINRQGVFSNADSLDHLGVLAGSLEDTWIIARFMAATAGGDPGHPGLYGGPGPPPPVRPRRLARLETAGWAAAGEPSRAALEGLIGGLEAAGIEVLGRADLPALEAYERALAELPGLWTALTRYEMRWPMLGYRDRYRDKLQEKLVRSVEVGEHMTLAQYREALARREDLRARHAALAAEVDAFITLSATGPAPAGADQGSALFNEPSSVIGMPAVSLPLLAVDGMPLGVQLLGPWHGDERLTAHARWIAAHVLDG